MKSLIVIPARLASTRLPRKLLLADTGKPLLQHTFEAASRSKRASGICIAADGEEIASAARAFRAEVIFTDPNLASGTDRVAVVAAARADVEIFVNVQGDEPEIDPDSIDRAIGLLESRPDAVMATLATPIRDRERVFDPSCVKVVFDHERRAMYFSRAPIPFAREWNDSLLRDTPAVYHQHIGLYAYRRDFLLRLGSMSRAMHERVESLEQLRVLAAGESIFVDVIDHPAVGVDTPEDYRIFVERFRAANRR